MDNHPFEVLIRNDVVSINDIPLVTAGPQKNFYTLFGKPDRMADASKISAPPGHRNNQIHFYETLGVTLNEHHDTCQIQEVTFIFDVELATHPTTDPFRGRMTIGGVPIVAGALERHLSDSSLTFTATLPGTWFTKIGSNVDDQAISVAVSTMGPKLRSGRRSKTRVIASVSLRLPHDPWDFRNCPNE